MIGVVGGSVEAPQVRWVKHRVEITSELLELAGPVDPTEIFRFAAPCAESGCQHFRNHECSLGAKLVEKLDETVTLLPTCSIRRSCRWFAERGRAACARCQHVVTRDYRPSPALRAAADPEIND